MIYHDKSVYRTRERIQEIALLYLLFISVKDKKSDDFIKIFLWYKLYQLVFWSRCSQRTLIEARNAWLHIYFDNFPVFLLSKQEIYYNMEFDLTELQ